jgi:CRP-like cAMP-binding protein
VGVYLEVEAGEGDRLVNKIRAGGSFGELSMMTDAPRTATVKCLTECYFGIVDKKVFS